MYQKQNPCGIISLILGIQALVLTCMPVIAIFVAVVSVILGIIGLTRWDKQKGQAIAGLCCATTAITINVSIIIMAILTAGVLEEISRNIEDMIYYW